MRQRMMFSILLVSAFGFGCEDLSERTNKEKQDRENTGINERDRQSGQITATDQSTASKDREITASIRQDLMAKDTLSTTAKNIKVVTSDGVVTLKGPVKSETERSEIQALAQGTAGVVRVDNQLEVDKETETEDPMRDEGNREAPY